MVPYQMSMMLFGFYVVNIVDREYYNIFVLGIEGLDKSHIKMPRDRYLN